MVDLREFKDLYIKTAHEYVDTIKKDIESLKVLPTNKEAIEELHRSFHSLKSQSIVMGYKNIGEVCMRFEDMFYEVKNGRKQVDEILISSVQEIIGKLERSVDSIQNTDQEQML